jgi:hypothetical protein
LNLCENEVTFLAGSEKVSGDLSVFGSRGGYLISGGTISFGRVEGL